MLFSSSGYLSELPTFSFARIQFPEGVDEEEIETIAGEYFQGRPAGWNYNEETGELERRVFYRRKAPVPARIQWGLPRDRLAVSTGSSWGDPYVDVTAESDGILLTTRPELEFEAVSDIVEGLAGRYDRQCMKNEVVYNRELFSYDEKRSVDAAFI